MSSDFQHHLVGRQVVYRGRHPGAEPEQGMVTSVNVGAGIVFVNYGRGSTSQATDAGDLTTLGGEPVSELVKRGSGRTTRQLLEAPDEFVFVVHTYQMMNHARTLQRRHVPEKTMDIVLCADVADRLSDISIPVVVDHAAWEAVDDRTACVVREHNSRFDQRIQGFTSA